MTSLPHCAKKTVLVDCEAGRRMGCASFCCRLIVRLQPGERDPGQPDNDRKNCVDKDPQDGLCVYFDRDKGTCTVWHERPAICRSYDCNQDPLLQIVLRQGFRSLCHLVTAPTPSSIDTKRLAVPYIETDGESSNDHR